MCVSLFLLTHRRKLKTAYNGCWRGKALGTACLVLTDKIHISKTVEPHLLWVSNSGTCKKTPYLNYAIVKLWVVDRHILFFLLLVFKEVSLEMGEEVVLQNRVFWSNFHHDLSTTDEVGDREGGWGWWYG